VATDLRSTATPVDNALRSPLFAGVLERLRAGSRWSVLDLGKVQPALVSLLQPLQCRLEVADLPAWLAAAGDLAAARPDTLAIEAVLPPPGERPLDLVLCWDLLNYLPLPLLAALMEAVAARCRQGTAVHALMMYSHRRMPAAPGAYLPCEDGRLVYAPVNEQDCAAPRYSSEQLAARTPRYRTDRAMLLHSGMQELLLECRG
jgi:hypothetical protein